MTDPRDGEAMTAQAWNDVLAHTGAEGYDHISADEAVGALVATGWRPSGDDDGEVREQFIEQATATMGHHNWDCLEFTDEPRYCVCDVKDQAEELVDAGWRPPPSGDVVEQAAELLELRDLIPTDALAAAEELRDAGLLRAPVGQDETFRAGGAILRAAVPGVDAPKARVFINGHEVPGVVAEHVPGEFISIPVPPDEETLRAADAAVDWHDMHERYGPASTWPPSVRHELIVALLRALGEASGGS